LGKSLRDLDVRAVEGKEEKAAGRKEKAQEGQGKGQNLVKGRPCGFWWTRSTNDVFYTSRKKKGVMQNARA